MSPAALKAAKRGPPYKDPEAGEFTQTVSFRATRAQHAAFIALGAGDWVRKKLDQARLGKKGVK